MTILKADWQPLLASSSVSAGAPTVTHVWCVETDHVHDSAEYVLKNAPGKGSTAETNKVPQLYEHLNLGNDVNTMLYAQDFAVAYLGESPTQGNFRWELRATYKQIVADTQGVEPGEPLPTNPCLWPSEWWLERGGSYFRARERDLDDLLVANSCGIPPDPIVTAEELNPVFVVERRECDFNVVTSHALTYHNTINSAIYLGQPPDTWRLQVAAGKMQRENGVPMWPMAYRLEFREQTWLEEMLDQGFNFKEGDHWHYNADDINETPLADPVKLDGACGKLADGQPAVWNGPFRFNKRMDFNLLNL